MTRNPSGDRRQRSKQPARKKQEVEKVRTVTVQPEMREKEKATTVRTVDEAAEESPLDSEATAAKNSSRTDDGLETFENCLNAVVEVVETVGNHANAVVEVEEAVENYSHTINEEAVKKSSNTSNEKTVQNCVNPIVEEAVKNCSNTIVEQLSTASKNYSIAIDEADKNYSNAVAEANNNKSVTVGEEPLKNYSDTVIEEPSKNYSDTVIEEPLKNYSDTVIEESQKNYPNTVIEKPLKNYSDTIIKDPSKNYSATVIEEPLKNNSDTVIQEPLNNHSDTTDEEAAENCSNTVVEEAVVENRSVTVVEVGKDAEPEEREVSQARRSEDPIGAVRLMQCGSLEIDEERQRRVAMMESLCQVNGSKSASSSLSTTSNSSIGSSSISSISSSSASSTKSNSSSSGSTNGSNSSTGSVGGGVNGSSKCHRDSEYADPQQRLAVLSFEQVRRLNDVMNEVVSIHGRGNFPTLEVRLRDLVTVVRSKLEEDPSNGGAGMRVRDIRLNGGAASHVLATESQPYNDLDLIFAVELASGRNYDKVKAAVLGSLFDLLPEGVSRKRITTCSLKEAYVSKMVKVSNDGDRWSLISLGNSRGHRSVELKFVDTMRRQFEFSVDSFQIVLDSLLLFYECSKLPIGENFYPTVVGESVYGDFQEALYHLHKKLISTRNPEEIRGGGLLKYCNLLVKMYKASQPVYIKTLERYMCSRFFIDFPDVGQQQAKLENYLWNHFVGPEEEALKYQYLMLLHSVVEESTVCLMGHERRQTLALIENLAFQVLCQEQQRLNSQQAPPGPQPTYVYANGYANGYYYAPVIPTACYTCTCTSWMACSS